MCGITGFILKNKKDSFIYKERIIDALRVINYRGPDDFGTYFSDDVALGHVRLSVLDLSDAAHQPMLDSSEQFVISYNGEVYNFRELKQSLLAQGHIFHSHSDTEVVLENFKAKGVESFSQLNGMFAFSILDKINNKLYIVRDRFGIKPLHYYEDENGLYFGSEIKSILSLVNGSIDINKDVLAEWSFYGSALGENTFYKNVKKVLPGHYLEINLDTKEINCHSYWLPESLPSKTLKQTGGLSQVVKNVKMLLEQSVKRQLVSDVPVGVFLSGGIDSSAITAFAAKHYEGKLKTYSVGFDYDKGINELPKARKVAKKFETEHHELKISGYDLADTVELLVEHHDSPFSDAANIPLYLLGQKVKNEVKVVLQGDGGDELFAGYKRYQTLSSSWLWRPVIPLLAATHNILPHNKSFYRRQRYLNALKSKSDAELMALILTTEDKSNSPLRIFSKDVRKELEKSNPFKAYVKCNQRFKNMDLVQRMLFTDTQIILPDIFLEKVDRSTMATSIEVRVPFLDYDLTDYVMSLPSSLKIKRGQKKWLLKQALIGLVPDDILFGPKTGFSVPYQYWLKGPLNELFYDKLAEIEASGNLLLDGKQIRNLMSEHLSGKKEHGFLLWKTLNLMIWLAKNGQ